VGEWVWAGLKKELGNVGHDVIGFSQHACAREVTTLAGRMELKGQVHGVVT
jgi:hypothetical protein